MRIFITAALCSLLLPQARALTVNISALSLPTCTYANGGLNVYVSGGIPPYTVMWSNGSTDPIIYGLPAGTYSVTATDANLDTASDSFTLTSTDLEAYGQFVPGCVDASLGLGPEYRLLAYATSPMPGEVGAMGMAPITMGGGYMGTLLSHSSGNTFMYIDAPGGWTGSGEIQIPFTDGSGCQGVVYATIPETPAFPSTQLLSVEGSCSGGANGSIEMYVGQAPNQWISELELVRDGIPLGLLRSAYSTNTDFGYNAQNVIQHDLAPGDYQVLTTTRAQDDVLQEIMDTYFDGSNTICKDTLWFTVPDLGFTCGTVEGDVYLDDNQNCARNGSERRLAQSILEIQPGGFFTMSDPYGHYWTQLPYGSYTIQQQSSLVVEHCIGGPIPFETSAATPFITQHIADTALVIRDVATSLGSSPARPGFQMSYSLRANNLTPGVTGIVTYTLTFDPTVSFVSANPTPTSVVGNTITWVTSSIQSYADRTVQAVFQVPADVNLIGTDLLATSTVSIAQPESDLTNNTAQYVTTITGSYDPNDKLVATESNNDGLFLIDEDEWLDYTIRFQNTGTDTAFFVVITDTLPAEVDPASFVPGSASHPYRVTMSGHGTLRFSFPNILLPDSNVNELASHGFVTFRIKARLPVLPGTTITNIGNIYFDYNPPIITPDATVVAEFSTGVNGPGRVSDLTIAPNPAHDQVRVTTATGAFAHLRIIAMDGREVLSYSVRGASATIPVGRLSEGTYVLIFTMEDGAIRRERFSKH